MARRAGACNESGGAFALGGIAMRIVTKVAAGMAGSALALGVGLAAAGQSQAASRTPDAHRSEWFSGYAAGLYNGPVVPRSVTANWTQPRVRAHGYKDAYTTIFAGFSDINTSGGNSGLSTHMPQLGTEADSIGGTPQYYAWYALGGYQGDPRTRFRHLVRPGDHLQASITCSGPARDRYMLRLTDISPRGRWTQTRRVTSQDVQDPTGLSVGVTSPRYGPALLADFHAVHFTGVNFNGHVIASLAPHFGRYNYVNPASETHVLATASGIGSAGSSFTATWHRQH
jgi:hypothetical protein